MDRANFMWKNEAHKWYPSCGSHQHVIPSTHSIQFPMLHQALFFRFLILLWIFNRFFEILTTYRQHLWLIFSIYRASKGVCNHQWRRSKVVSSCQGMNTTLKISVPREHGCCNNVCKGELEQIRWTKEGYPAKE